MRTLVLNSGSSSIKFSVFRTLGDQPTVDPTCLCDGEVSGLGSAEAELQMNGTDGQPIAAATSNLHVETPADALSPILQALQTAKLDRFDNVGYRVVHPGPKLDRHQRITPEVLKDLEAAASFAPLHDPAVLALINRAIETFPHVLHYACFDTVFHETMPEQASIYPIPLAFRERGVRRYGFHGLSCESVVRQLQEAPEGCPERLVIAHLGSGCSVTAAVGGRSVDTSMGLTPTGGVVMGTRPGDLDPGLILYLLRQQTGDRDQAISATETLLNDDSGLVALSGLPNDVRALRQAATKGSSQAVLALEVFTRSITKTIGSFCWLLGGLDAIALTGGIGEHDALTRSEVLANLEAIGVSIDSQRNQAPGSGLRTISSQASKTSVLVVPADEDRMIAVHVARMARSSS